jgi:hypothetical protein
MSAAKQEKVRQIRELLRVKLGITNISDVVVG